MSLAELLFSFHGRIGRRTFWLWNGAFYLIILTAATLINKLGPGMTPQLLPVVISLLIYPDLAVTAKRWHDRDKSNVWLLLSMPIIVVRMIALMTAGQEAGAMSSFQLGLSVSALLCGLWIFAECGFFEGSPEENRFGAPQGQGLKSSDG
jgi:uncharacterized membrane protein YhaH (DUF805 family)